MPGLLCFQVATALTLRSAPPAPGLHRAPALSLHRCTFPRRANVHGPLLPPLPALSLPRLIAALAPVALDARPRPFPAPNQSLQLSDRLKAPKGHS